MPHFLRTFYLLLAISCASAQAAVPTITNATATPGANGTAKITATVNPGGLATTVFFAYGRTTTYGSAATANVAEGTALVEVTVNLKGLIGGVTYNFQVTPTNADGTGTPTDNQTFDLLAFTPTIKLQPVVHSSGAVNLRATVTTNGTGGNAVFQFGADPTSAVVGELPATTITPGVDATVTGTILPGQFLPADKYRLVIKDAAGAIIAKSEVVRINTPPKAVADAYTLTDDEPLTLNVLDNDVRTEGDAITIESFTKPRFGTVTQSGTTLTYTPDQTLFAVDTFRYTIIEADPFKGTATATVTIRPLRATLGGTHGGIIRDFRGREVGYFRITATALGSFTGVIEIDGKSYLVSGTFGTDGSFHGTASRDGTLLPVDFTTVRGDDGTTIKAKFSEGKYASNVEFTDEEATTRGPLAGRYTVELPSTGSTTGDGDGGITGSDTTTPGTTESNLPEGTGWTALKVGDDGSVRVKGRLPDGRSFSTRGALVVGPDGPQISFFDDVDETRVIGLFNVGDTVTGTVRVDRGKSGDDTFPNGYDVLLTANGARYISPDNGGGITSSTGGDAEDYTITFNGGGLSGGLTRNLKLTDSGQFKILNGGPENLKIKVDDSSGRFTTKITVDDAGRRLKGTGVFVQANGDNNGGGGGGVFKGPNKPGSIQITAGSTPTPTTPPPIVLPTPNPNATPIGIDLNLQRARRR